MPGPNNKYKLVKKAMERKAASGPYRGAMAKANPPGFPKQDKILSRVSQERKALPGLIPMKKLPAQALKRRPKM